MTMNIPTDLTQMVELAVLQTSKQNTVQASRYQHPHLRKTIILRQTGIQQQAVLEQATS